MDNIFEEDPLSAGCVSWDCEEIKNDASKEAIDFEALSSGSFEDYNNFEDDFTRELEGLVLEDKMVEEEEFKLMGE